MNTKGTEYGSVFENSGGWQIHWYNPLTSSKEYLGYKKNQDEANEILRMKNFDFYSQYSQLLPRCISLNRRDKTYFFTLGIRGKTVRIGTYKTVDEAVQAKIDLIAKMI